MRDTGADRDVVMIKLTGINTLTEELALPNATPGESANPYVTDSPRYGRNRAIDCHSSCGLWPESRRRIKSTSQTPS